MSEKQIFVINPGSTSTKLALYSGAEQIFKSTTYLPTEALSSPHLVDQLDMRMQGIETCMREHGVRAGQLDIIACRGGNMPGIEGGCYAVNRHLLNVCTYAPYKEHASNIACILGSRLAESHGTPVIICDGTGVDELDELARLTGIPSINMIPTNHVLNSRMVSRMTAERLGKKYEDCTFIVCHLGGGVGLTLHKKGRLADCCSSDMGPMSPERAGRVSCIRMTDFCFNSGMNAAEIKRYLYGGSGVLAHLGTQDMMQVQKMVQSGDKKAALVVKTMAYQIAKGIAELSAPCCGKVDRIIVTGGLAHYTELVQLISERVSFIAPIELLAGEFEMEALAAAALRVLNGEETPKTYDLPPYGYDTVDDFYKAFPQAVRE